MEQPSTLKRGIPKKWSTPQNDDRNGWFVEDVAESEGVSHAPVNNCSIALRQVVNYLYRLFITLTVIIQKELGLPYLFLCQLCSEPSQEGFLLQWKSPDFWESQTLVQSLPPP